MRRAGCSCCLCYLLSIAQQCLGSGWRQIRLLRTLPAYLPACCKLQYPTLSDLLALCRWPFTKAAVEQMAWEMLPGGLRRVSRATSSQVQPVSSPGISLAAVAKAVQAAAAIQQLPQTQPCLLPCPCRRHPGAERAGLDPRHQLEEAGAGGQGETGGRAWGLAVLELGFAMQLLARALVCGCATGHSRGAALAIAAQRSCAARLAAPPQIPATAASPFQEPDISNIRVWMDDNGGWHAALLTFKPRWMLGSTPPHSWLQAMCGAGFGGMLCLRSTC